ncbi:hypothetical protein NP493_1732g00011 [Ridgeia piscesae]|uniref:Chitin-binding type-2 domain-containing protein n=1 Tax=Ridgeia piscesae TaxID=27915 RepID=A0AAD9N8T0_RIDPI|nr:hypothetical protein NP493_1732g00011 [Ridgeia piscesae]
MAAMTFLRPVVVASAVLLALAASVKATCDTTGSACIRSCKTARNGDHQSCDGCHMYVTCSNGGMYNHRPCPAGLMWNDNKKRCDWKSRTCKCIVFPKGPAVDGQWSEWDPWDTCSVTCGGGTGVANADCSQCICDLDVVEGRVIDRATDLGLADVNIYTVGREWSPAAVTGSDGRFSITDVCSTGLRLTARKGGYESALNEYGVQTGSSVVIVMYTLEKPTFTKEPLSTAGFKDGDLVAADGGSVYEITNLEKDDEGQFACRAASLGGKVFSRLASLVVKGP